MSTVGDRQGGGRTQLRPPLSPAVSPTALGNATTPVLSKLPTDTRAPARAAEDWPTVVCAAGAGRGYRACHGAGDKHFDRVSARRTAGGANDNSTASFRAGASTMFLG